MLDGSRLSSQNKVGPAPFSTIPTSAYSSSSASTAGLSSPTAVLDMRAAAHAAALATQHASLQPVSLSQTQLPSTQSQKHSQSQTQSQSQSASSTLSLSQKNVQMPSLSARLLSRRLKSLRLDSDSIGLGGGE